MSRRWVGRESDSSHKRSRRDGKPATERPSGNLHLEGGAHSDRDQKHSQRLRDALPLEAPPGPGSKIETGTKSKESEKRISEQSEGIKSSSKPTDGQRPRLYFQHDERGRRHVRGALAERGWWRDSKNQHSENAEKIGTRDPEQNHEKSNQTRWDDNHPEQNHEKSNQTRWDDNHAWRHDAFYKMERDQQPPRRKRPAFRERKDEVVPRDTEKTEAEPVIKGEERNEGRERHNRRESQRGNFLERDRFGGGGSYQGRERFNGRRGYQLGGGGRVEKWKHDLYEAVNRSPTPKNEEDLIAKVETLLAS